MLPRLLIRQFMPVCRTSSCLRFKSDNNGDKRSLWIGFARHVRMTEMQIKALSADIKDVHLHTRYTGALCAFLTFKSEKIADRNFFKLRKLQMPGMEVQYVGVKRYEGREKTRLVYYYEDPTATKEKIQKLSKDILHVHIRPNKISRSVAFLDFETEAKANAALQEMLKKNLNVIKQGQKWLIPEDYPRTLFLEFPELSTTLADVKALSPDIIKYDLRRKRSGQSYAYLTFETQQIMEEHFKMFQKMGLFVDYVGWRRTEQHKEAASRTLWLAFNSEMSKDDIRKYSQDITDIILKTKTDGSCYAYVEFATEELAKENLVKFQAKGLKAEQYLMDKAHVEHPKGTEIDELREYCCEQNLAEPIFQMVKVWRKENNEKLYSVKVIVGDKEYHTEGECLNMKMAKISAATKALKILKFDYSFHPKIRSPTS